jgi:hypothetical protein
MSATELKMSARSQIVLLYWALAFLALFGIAFYCLLHVVPPPPPTNNDDQIAGFFAFHSTSIRIGAALAMTVCGFTLPFAAVISVQMARLGREMWVWAILQGMGGALVSVWLIFPALVQGTASFTADRAHSVTRALSDLSFLAQVTTTPYYIFQVIPIAYACLSNKVDSPFFPRWLGYLSIWSFLITEVGPLAFLTKFGPFAWNGLVVFWLPVFIFFAWVIALSYVFITNLSRESKDSDLVESSA